ncbi:uncharacterized protein LOC117116340, partial [Anneissia japonica]|uniref:uncharacterized protein LOC117116340 n=1 Tax=Anneissia japonica TaxID=1529436 RepID=UPI00142595E2
MAVVAAHKTQKFAEEESKKEIVGTETKNKLFKRAEQHAKHREHMKKVYLKGILMCNGKMKERYFQKMTSEFNKCQLFEKERLENLKYELLRFVNALDISVLPG